MWLEFLFYLHLFYSDVKDHPDLGCLKQQLALDVLRRRTKPPPNTRSVSTEVELVPEHIETRTLFDPSHPGFPQVCTMPRCIVIILQYKQHLNGSKPSLVHLFNQGTV